MHRARPTSATEEAKGAADRGLFRGAGGSRRPKILQLVPVSSPPTYKVNGLARGSRCVRGLLYGSSGMGIVTDVWRTSLASLKKRLGAVAGLGWIVAADRVFERRACLVCLRNLFFSVQLFVCVWSFGRIENRDLDEVFEMVRAVCLGRESRLCPLGEAWRLLARTYFGRMCGEDRMGFAILVLNRHVLCALFLAFLHSGMRYREQGCRCLG